MLKRETLSAMALQTSGALFCAAVSFVLVAWLGRTLGAELFGRYVLVLNAATIALVAIEGGWPNFVYRQTVEIGGTPADGLAARQRAFAHVVLIGGVLALGAGFAALFAGPMAAVFAAALVCMGVVALMNTVSAGMRGAGRFAREAAWQSAGRVVSALLIVGLVLWLPGGWLGWIFLAWAAGLLLVALAMGRGWLAWPDWSGWRGSVSRVLPLMYLAGALTLLLKLDVLLLGALGAGDVELSDYAAVTRFVEAGLLLFAPLTNVLLREFRLVLGQEAAFAATLRRWVSLGLVAGVVAVVAALLFGERLVVLVFGAQYADAGSLLQWVALMLPFAFANLVLVQAWIARERDAVLAGWVLSAVAVLAAAVWTGWHIMGLHGVALAVALAHAGLFLALWVGLEQHPLVFSRRRESA